MKTLVHSEVRAVQLRKLTQVYEQLGQHFPNYERYEPGSARGKVLLCPPNVVNSVMLRNLGRVRTAVRTRYRKSRPIP